MTPQELIEFLERFIDKNPTKKDMKIMKIEKTEKGTVTIESIETK